jgi:HAD superfamily hydrolase (TIGR01484 family)
MKKYLISLDLDGTLLYEWETISKPTLNYIEFLKKQGHQFVIATGRPYRSSVEFHSLLSLDTPLINYNGGLVTSKKDPNFKE